MLLQQCVGPEVRETEERPGEQCARISEETHRSKRAVLEWSCVCQRKPTPCLLEHTAPLEYFVFCALPKTQRRWLCQGSDREAIANTNSAACATIVALANVDVNVDLLSMRYPSMKPDAQRPARKASAAFAELIRFPRPPSTHAPLLFQWILFLFQGVHEDKLGRT